MRNIYLAFSRGTWFAREVRTDPMTGKRRETWRSLGITGKENRKRAEKLFRAVLVEIERADSPQTDMSLSRFAVQ